MKRRAHFWQVDTNPSNKKPSIPAQPYQYLYAFRHPDAIPSKHRPSALLSSLRKALLRQPVQGKHR